MWAECRDPNSRRNGVRTFFAGKREHCPGLAKGCCVEVTDLQATRAAAMMAIQGRRSMVRYHGCNAPGLACAYCLREEGKGLWVTTTDAPRPLEELFPSTQELGQDPSEASDGSSGQPSASKKKKKTRTRKSKSTP